MSAAKEPVGGSNHERPEAMAIASALQTERDRAAEVIAHYAGKADQAERETIALHTRAEKAEATSQQWFAAADKERIRALKAEHDLAEAVDGLMPFADKGNRISGNETCTVQWSDCRHAATLIAKHTPPKPT